MKHMFGRTPIGRWPNRTERRLPPSSVAATVNGSVAAGFRTAAVSLPDAAVQTDAALFPGFTQRFVVASGVTVAGRQAAGATINTLVGGAGPPLLLLHGHPQTHVCWHKVAGRLAESFTVVLTDLRGYGDSTKPDGGTDHIDYSKTAMGADQVQVMSALGFDRFAAVGHDRGGRTLHAMMVEYPERLERVVTLDIAPTDQMYDQTDQEFATKYVWWFFQIQHAPIPEKFIGAMPDLYLQDHLDVQCKTPGAVTPHALAAYQRCYRQPEAIHAVCEDYRAGAGVDSDQLRKERAAGRRSSVPMLALWGQESVVGRAFDVLAMWRKAATTVSGYGLPCGHLIPEEDPDGLIAAITRFLNE